LKIKRLLPDAAARQKDLFVRQNEFLEELYIGPIKMIGMLQK
jgi:hypothetical protein